MELIQRLDVDHRLIDEAAGSFLAWAAEAEDPTADEAVLGGYLEFFSCYVCGAHHRAEEVLFTTLADRAEVPPRRGPLAVLRREHVALARSLDELAGHASEVNRLDGDGRARVRSLVHAIWQHVDKEVSVLMPESIKRLERHGISGLKAPLVSEEEETSRQVAEALVKRYEPIDDLEAMRGDGCMACIAFAESCHGIEAEWWTSWELAHYRSLDEG
jgi:hemerythrin-like domain-containing protein